MEILAPPLPLLYLSLSRFVWKLMPWWRTANSAALAVQAIPSMIEQGYRAIAVAFDLWGFSNMVKDKLNQAAEYASQHGEKKDE